MISVIISYLNGDTEALTCSWAKIYQSDGEFHCSYLKDDPTRINDENGAAFYPFEDFCCDLANIRFISFDGRAVYKSTAHLQAYMEAV